MTHGGSRPGAGRKPGGMNKAQAARKAAAVEAGMTPLEFLLSVMRDPKKPASFRQDAAKAAAPYVHPKLAQMTLQGDADKPLHTKHTVELIVTDPKA